MLAASALSRLRSPLSLLFLPGLLAASVAARAADLGPILLTSPAGEPLQGLVSMSLIGEEAAEDLNVAIGSPAEYGWLEIARPSWVDDVEVHVAIEEEGGPKVRIWTAEPPPDRRFSLLLVVSSPTGRSLRQYDVVLRDAEVLLAPAEPQARPASDAPSRRDVGVTEGDVDQGAASVPVTRPSRRAVHVPDRGEPQVRRNLSISSAGTRLSDSALEKRAQRLEESAAAQQRALSEANARITELQGQIEKLERLLALKGVTVEAEKAAAQKPVELAKATDSSARSAGNVEKPAEAAHGSKPVTDAAATPPGVVTAAEGVAQPPLAPASAAAPMEEVDPATEAQPEQAGSGPAPETHDKPPAEGDSVTHSAEDADHDDGVTGLLWTVGGAVLTLLLATLGAFWWRRRRARHPVAAPATAAAAASAGEAAQDAAAADTVGSPVDEPSPPPAEAATEAAAAVPAEAVAAIGAVDEQIAAALDEPIGDAAPADVAMPAATPVASLEAVTAEPAPGIAADELDAMFSEEAIAAAQAAIQEAAGAAPAPVAQGDAALAGATSTSDGPAEAEAPPGEDDEAEDPADLEDVEVNLAKAYIDMGDPDGARAILESMMSDPDDPDRAALARRTMRRFGLRRSAPPAEGAAAEG